MHHLLNLALLPAYLSMTESSESENKLGLAVCWRVLVFLNLWGLYLQPLLLSRGTVFPALQPPQDAQSV